MTVPGLHDLSAHQLRAGFLSRTFSPVDVIEALAQRISLTEPAIHSFTTLTLDEAAAGAVVAEERYAAGRARPLEGIPFAAKDLFDTAGIRTTYGSAIFRGHFPGRDAEAVSRLMQEGAILVGKTATHEFAWGITTVNQNTGSSSNPWDPTRITGGSSGGSAAAVAARQVPVALGSDTGGSIRIPAAFCGVLGLKPSFGLVSVAGLFPLAPSLDHVGLMARDPSDLGDLLEALAIPTHHRPGGFVQATPPPGGTAVASRLRVGLCQDLRPVRLGAAASDALEAAAAALQALPAEIVEVRFPEAEAVMSAFAWTQQAEALDTHMSRDLFPGREADYGPDVRARLQAASQVTLDMYLEAQRLRDSVRAGFHRLFEEVDVLLGPISPVAPPGPGQNEIPHFGQQLTLRELVMPFVVPQNLAGLPAVAMRAGFDRDGLPVGVQLCGPVGSDLRLLEVARGFHEATLGLQSAWPEPVAAGDR